MIVTKKTNGVYKPVTRKPKYFDDFYPELIKAITLRKEGRLRTDRISLEEVRIKIDKEGNRVLMLNIYQRAGVPAPSETGKHGKKEDYMKKQYRKAIELGLDNLTAHKYIQGYKPRYKKGTHTITGYEIEFRKADQAKRKEARKAKKKKK
jgi:hypothetical protein